MSRARRLLTLGHSYVVELNRRLAHELARAGRGRWEVTAIAPARVHTGTRFIYCERGGDEPCSLEVVTAHFSRFSQLMVYEGRLRTLLRQSWDMVHCWEEPYVLAGAQVACLTPRATPLVYTTFQNISKRYPPPFSWIERYCLRRCAGWIAGGETVAATMLGRGYGIRPYRDIPLGVDLEIFRPDPAARERALRGLSWPAEGPPVVGFAGRFVPEKGLMLLTRALSRLKSPWRALFIGEGPLENDLRAWASAHGDRVRILTSVAHAEVPAQLNAMDLACVPSQTTARWREQFGRAIIEAFACGVPVIAAASGEIPHVVEDAGVLLPEADEQAWAASLDVLLRDHDRRRELAARGLDRARRLYAWPEVARRHLEFFEDLLA